MGTNIYKELNLYDKTISQADTISRIFECMEYGVSGFNIGPNYLSYVASVLPDDIILSCPIDYPYGTSSSKVRQHQVISNINNGANTIDLVINPVYVVNDQSKQLLDDISANMAICQDRKVTFRLMTEYRQFDEWVYREIVKICRILRVEYLFPSTGNFNDDYVDNLIVCKKTKLWYTGINMITNGNIWQKEHYENVTNSRVYGIRVNYGNIRILRP